MSKYAFLAYSERQAFFLKGMYEAMEADGHISHLCYSAGFKPNENCFHVEWDKWRLSELLKYDKLVIFNGFAAETFAQTCYLKQHYKERMLFCERGWLPQADNIYLDEDGLGGRSSLSKKRLYSEDRVDFSKIYPRSTTNTQDREYILVPLQLENDTSIVLDSPYFKTMPSLINYVIKHFSDYKIVVTTHPKSKDTVRLPGVFYGENTLALAQHARAIIGINSTSIIEALQFQKPTMMFGRSVLSGTQNLTAPTDLLNPRSVLDFKPNPDAITGALSELSQYQFSCKNPRLLI